MNKNYDEDAPTGAAIAWACVLSPIMCLIYTMIGLIAYNIFFK